MTRTLLLLGALMVVGCGTSEPLDKTASPIGCWTAPATHEALTLRTDGVARHVTAYESIVGTWQLQDGALIFDMGGALQRWQVVDLTASDMWTDGGSVVHWQSAVCAP